MNHNWYKATGSFFKSSAANITLKPTRDNLQLIERQLHSSPSKSYHQEDDEGYKAMYLFYRNYVSLIKSNQPETSAQLSTDTSSASAMSIVSLFYHFQHGAHSSGNQRTACKKKETYITQRLSGRHPLS